MPLDKEHSTMCDFSLTILTLIKTLDWTITGNRRTVEHVLKCHGGIAQYR